MPQPLVNKPAPRPQQGHSAAQLASPCGLVQAKSRRISQVIHGGICRPIRATSAPHETYHAFNWFRPALHKAYYEGYSFREDNYYNSLKTKRARSRPPEGIDRPTTRTIRT